MKTHLLSIAALLLMATAASGQTFVIDWHKDNPVKGTPTGGTVKREGTIRNLTPDTKELYFSYDLGAVSFDHTVQLCINLCWALSPGPDDPFIREGQVLKGNDTLPLFVDLTPHGAEGESVVRVSMFDGNNMMDKVDFDVVFNISTVSSVIDASAIGLTVGPNPSSGAVFVSGTALETMRSAGLYDMSGALVRSYGLGNTPHASFTTNGLAAGAYRLVFTDRQGNRTAAPVVVAP